MRIRVRYPFLLSLCLLAVLFRDGMGIVGDGLLAIFLHEAGHTLLYVLLLRQRPVLQIGFGGIALRWNTAGVSARRQAMILLAGPAANLFTALFFLLLCGQQFRMSVWLFAVANMLLGVFNLLPLGFLDGGGLLELFLLSFLSVRRSQTVMQLCETVCLLLLSAFLLFFTTDWTVRIALLSFLGYYCCKSFCAKN